jgi:hypothetical protein
VGASFRGVHDRVAEPVGEPAGQRRGDGHLPTKTSARQGSQSAVLRGLACRLPELSGLEPQSPSPR